MIATKDILSFPNESGIYVFLKNHQPIYIGKSVNIRTRLKSHLRQANFSRKEAALIADADSVSYRVTLSNFDAILLEARLIKRHQPKYNVLWKDDKNLLYIKITRGEKYPKIVPVRAENDGKSLYFGPFSSSKMTYALVHEIRHLIPFCTNRTVSKRPCFYSRIGLCSPCPNYIESLEAGPEKNRLLKAYQNNVQRVRALLSGQSNQLVSRYDKKLRILIKLERYEEAIPVRNNLLRFALFLERRSFQRLAESTDVDTEKLAAEFNDFLVKNFGRPAQEERPRIECYDISNLFGKNSSGSMVVFENGRFDKSEYKRFAIKQRQNADIFMLEEVISRRIGHTEWSLPDLILLDGGKPQLRQIAAFFRSNNIDIPLASIAKRPDRVFVSQNGLKTVAIRRDSLLFRVFQALRDESHRFAKKYHILLRNRNVLN